jgi:hypothetical protein
MTPLQQWQWAFQTLLAHGYYWLNAIETVHALYPGLWQQAVAEVARTTGPDPVVKTRVYPRPGPRPQTS